MEKKIKKHIGHPIINLISIFYIISIMSCAETKKSLNENEIINGLLGKWTGTWTTPYQILRGQDCLIEIDKVSRDQSIVWLTYSAGPAPALGAKSKWDKFGAKYIPPDKFEWERWDLVFKFQLKDGILRGTKTYGRWEEQIVMKKIETK